MLMRVLVTGGAGYIGSVLCMELLQRGHHVTVLDNFMYRQNSFGHLCWHPNLKIVRGDARDIVLVSNLLVDADVLIPLAALVGAPACDQNKFAAFATNEQAITGAIDVLQASGQKVRIIYPNTNSGYGRGGAEECTEETPLNPISHYARTKQAAEDAVLRYGGISLRLATVFGMSPRMRLDLLVNDFVYRAVNDRSVTLFEADFRRNYIHVKDVARAFAMALHSYNAMAGEAYNVGLSSANLSKRQLCEKIRSWVPGFEYVESRIGEDPDKRDYIVSNAKIEAAGWKATLDLDFGIQELLKGYQMIRRLEHANA